MKKTPLDIIREANIKALNQNTDVSVGDMLSYRVANSRHQLSQLGHIGNLTVWGIEGRGTENFVDRTRFVVRDGEEAVGMLTLWPDPQIPNGAMIVMVYIQPQYRHKGVGEQLYRFIIGRGITLMSGYEISPMALSVWSKLARDHSIKVGVLNRNNQIDYEGDPIEKVMQSPDTSLIASMANLTEDAAETRKFYREITPHASSYGRLEFKPEIKNWPPSPQEWREVERAVLQSPEWVGYWARMGWTSWTSLSSNWWYNPHKNEFSFYDVPMISYFHDNAEPERGVLILDTQGRVIPSDSQYSHLTVVLPSALRLCQEKVKEAQPKLRYLKGGYYIRFGAWPQNERSRNWIIRDKEVYEKGVSAYHANYDLDTGLWEIDLTMNHDTITGTLEHLIMSNRPIFIIRGEEYKHDGADGEPLLRNVRIIQQLHKGDCCGPGDFRPRGYFSMVYAGPA